MPFIKTVGKDFIIKDNHIELAGSYKDSAKPKKITGSRFASILGLNKFTSPAKIWAIMNGIYKDDFDPMYSKIGNEIEPKLKEYAENVSHIKYKSYDPSAVYWDIFKENKIFGGIPDGEPLDENGNLVFGKKEYPLIEIKTTSVDKFKFAVENGEFVLQKDENGRPIVKTPGAKFDSWFDSKGDIVVPEEYVSQLSLYCYLRNTNYGRFVIGFLDTDDYIHPEQFTPEKNKIYIVDFYVDLDKFQDVIDYGEKWYRDYILTKKSPELSEGDIEWLKINKIIE